jgi:hypothetical protein
MNISTTNVADLVRLIFILDDDDVSVLLLFRVASLRVDDVVAMSAGSLFVVLLSVVSTQ